MNATIANRDDSSMGWDRWAVYFGAYGSTVVLVYAQNCEAALDEAFDWAEENDPGLFCDESVQEAYEEALKAGENEEEALETAEIDTIRAGNSGRPMPSWEVHFNEVSREEWKRLMGAAR